MTSVYFFMENAKNAPILFLKNHSMRKQTVVMKYKIMDLIPSKGKAKSKLGFAVRNGHMEKIPN